jgi:hypothetical protein
MSSVLWVLSCHNLTYQLYVMCLLWRHIRLVVGLNFDKKKTDKTNPVSTSVRNHKQVRQPSLCKYLIYSLLFLFCILFIVSTQITASRRKNLKSDVLTLWLDIYSNLVTVAKTFFFISLPFA